MESINNSKPTKIVIEPTFEEASTMMMLLGFAYTSDDQIIIRLFQQLSCHQERGLATKSKQKHDYSILTS